MLTYTSCLFRCIKIKNNTCNISVVPLCQIVVLAATSECTRPANRQAESTNSGSEDCRRCVYPERQTLRIACFVTHIAASKRPRSRRLHGIHCGCPTAMEASNKIDSLYWSCCLLGCGFLTPWSSFLSAVDYFDDIYPVLPRLLFACPSCFSI